MKKKHTLLVTLFVLSAFLGTQSVIGQEILYTEDFDYTPGELPTGWVIDADQPPEWSVNNSQISGGEAPELYMGYGFQVGLSRLVSTPIDIDGYENLALRYKQYLINYAADAGEVIGLDVTFDGGTTWEPLWESLLGLLNIPQDEYVYYFNVPSGATEMQFAFRYDGNNNFINGWAIDDVVVESVVDNDLVARTLTGNSTPNVGEAGAYEVTVQNGGQVSQDTYTIKLIDENGEELASMQGETIAFAETKSFTLTWTPNQDDLGSHTVHAVVESTADVNNSNNETAPMVLTVQYVDTEDVAIGEGTLPGTEVPYDFYNLNSLTQTLYFAEDITATEETMTGIQYTGYFDNDTEDVPIQIYLAETTQTDLADDWVDPASFTLVYDGTVDFQRGLNNVYIPFDTTYDYTGDNLVVYTNKSYPEQVLWVGFLSSQDYDIQYSRALQGNDEPFDALNPPNGFPRFQVPNITLFFSSGELSVLDHQSDAVSIRMYPNPTRSELHIESTGAIQEIQVVNALGQEIMHKKIGNVQKHTLNVDQLSSGFYLVQVLTSNGVTTKKIQVN